jgi:hypothetical protein
MSASWELEEKPSWFLGDLRPEPRLVDRPSTIHRSVFPSPELIERSAAEGALMMRITFALFNRWTEINSAAEGHFMERISPGAFKKSIKENLVNIRATLSHGKDPALGGTVLGTIETIREESDSASALVSLFRSVPPLLVDGLRAGCYGASFCGSSIKSKVDYRPERSAFNPEGIPEVTRTEIRLKDIGPTPFAAYADTSVEIGER